MCAIISILHSKLLTLSALCSQVEKACCSLSPVSFETYLQSLLFRGYQAKLWDKLEYS